MPGYSLSDVRAGSKPAIHKIMASNSPIDPEHGVRTSCLHRSQPLSSACDLLTYRALVGFAHKVYRELSETDNYQYQINEDSPCP